MATPEVKIKQKIRRRMEKLANESGLPLNWDTPPASEYGSGGRPDHTCRIGFVIFDIEVKARDNGKATVKQAAFQATLLKHGHYTLMVCGQRGVDQVYAKVRDMLIESVTQENIAKYIADAHAVLLAASRLAMEPVRKQTSLDIAPGSGVPMQRTTVFRGHKAT